MDRLRPLAMGCRTYWEREVSEKLTRATADRDGGLVFDADNLKLGETWIAGWQTACAIRSGPPPTNATSRWSAPTYARYWEP